MSAAGSVLPAPALGDEARALKQVFPATDEAAEVVYTILVRHGSVVTETREQGIAWSLTMETRRSHWRRPRMHGVGYDNLDLDAIQAAGITIVRQTIRVSTPAPLLSTPSC